MTDSAQSSSSSTSSSLSSSVIEYARSALVDPLDFTLEFVVAHTSNFGIGYCGTFPWPRLPKDVAMFKALTLSDTKDGEGEKKNVVLMGMKTYESIPSNFRPLEGRINIVLTRNTNTDGKLSAMREKGVWCFNYIWDALTMIRKRRHEINRVFVIGGGDIYNQCMVSDLPKIIHSNLILNPTGAFRCDTYFKGIDPTKWTVDTIHPIVMDGVDNTIPTQITVYKQN